MLPFIFGDDKSDTHCTQCMHVKGLRIRCNLLCTSLHVQEGESERARTLPTHSTYYIRSPATTCTAAAATPPSVGGVEHPRYNLVCHGKDNGGNISWMDGQRGEVVERSQNRFSTRSTFHNDTSLFKREGFFISSLRQQQREQKLPGECQKLIKGITGRVTLVNPTCPTWR